MTKENLKITKGKYTLSIEEQKIRMTADFKTKAMKTKNAVNLYPQSTLKKRS